MNQKSTKKLTGILIIFCLALMLTACNAAKEKNDKPKTDSDMLYNKGLEMVSLLNEMAASEEYRTLFTPDNLNHIFEELVKGDYENCIAVYQVNISDTQILSFLTLSGLEPNAFSDNLLSQITQKSYSSFFTQLVARQSGTEALAVSSILACSSLFVYEDLKECTMYIYEYTDSYPVVVYFYPGEDGAVLATANYILLDDLKAADEAAFSEALTKQFILLGISPDITKIK